MVRKVIALTLICCLSFEQAFAQTAGNIDLSGAFPGISSLDRFRPLQVRSLSYDRASDAFDLFVDTGDLRNGGIDSTKAAVSRLNGYFRLGIALPDDIFWVNLRPDAKDRIIDPVLGKTDLGRVLLEADLCLKKDLATALSPRTTAGRRYWEKLYAKAETLFGSAETAIPTVTRPWIVPGEIIVRQDSRSVYVYKAGLEIRLEQDRISGDAGAADHRLNELNAYASGLIRENILPRLTQRVNSSRHYAELRQVYYSLILAKWFKDHFRRTAARFARDIDSGNITGLTSQTPWSKEHYFSAYLASFRNGEFESRETVAGAGGTAVRTYASGGISGLMSGIANRMVAITGKTSVIPDGTMVMRYDGSSLLPVDASNDAAGGEYANRVVEAQLAPRQTPGLGAVVEGSAAALAAATFALRRKLSPSEEEKILSRLARKRFKAVIWDADGVIVDPTRAWIAAWARVCRENNGPEVTDEFYYEHLCQARTVDSLQQWLPGVDEKGAMALKAQLYRYVSDFVDEHGIVVFPSTVKQIEELAGCGIPIAVGSASDLSPGFLGKAGIRKMMSSIITTKDVSQGKPAPEIFLTACGNLAVDPAEAIVVGDSVVDMLGGKAGGFGLVIGIDRGGKRQALYEAGADLVVEDIAEIALAELMEGAVKDGGFFQTMRLNRYLKGLESVEAGKREKACRALGELKDARAVDPLISRCADDSHYVVSSAIYALAKLGDIRAQKPILEVLKSRAAWEPSVREAVCYAQAVFPGENARSALVRLLYDHERQVRETAQKTLRELGWGETIITSYLEGLNGADKSRIIIVLSSALQDPRIIAAVEPLLNDPDPHIRWAARNNYQIDNRDSAFSRDSAGSLRDGGNQDADLGGVDFRRLRMQTRTRINSPAVPAVPRAWLDAQLRRIRLEMAKGGMPYLWMKEFAVACAGRADADTLAREFSGCVAELLKSDEEQARDTSEELKEIVRLLG